MLTVNSVMLRRGDGETQRQTRFADTKWPERLRQPFLVRVFSRTAASMGDALPRDASSDYSSTENGGKYAETCHSITPLGSRCSAAQRRARASVALASAHQFTTTFMLARGGGLTNRNAPPDGVMSNERPLASK